MKIKWETFYAIYGRYFVKESQKLKTCGTGGGKKTTNTGLGSVYTECDLLCSYSTNDASGQCITYYGKESNSKNKIPLKQQQ